MGSGVDGKDGDVRRIQAALEKPAGVGESMRSAAGDGSWCCTSFADVPVVIGGEWRSEASIVEAALASILDCSSKRSLTSSSRRS